MRRPHLLAAAIVALAFALRAPGLMEWWLNPDEGIYFSVLTHDRFADFWAEALTTAHPPLYFLILRAIGVLTTEVLWFRAVALVSGCAAVYVFVLLGRELGGPGSRGWAVGLLTGLLLAVSPRAIILSQVIRPYMLLILLLAGSLLLLLRYLRAPSTPRLVAHVACSITAVLLHYSAAMALGVIGVLVVADGVHRGLQRPEWRRLLAAQTLPLALLATLYVLHLREFSQSAESVDTMACCLSAYLAHSPIDVWYGLVGFHSLVAGEWLAVPAALLTLIGLGGAAFTRTWTPFLAAGAGFAVALVASFLQQYPFGPTRHSFWLFVFVLPALGWALGTVFTAGRKAALIAGSALVVLVVAAGPLTSVLDSEQRPRDISERVLRNAYMPAMAEVLDPQTTPQLVLISTETYRVLIPLFFRERQSAETSRNGLFSHFRWGERDVIVMPGRDFASLPSQLDLPNHLYQGMRTAEEDFGLAPPRNGEAFLVLAGGYASRGMTDLVDLARQVESLGTTTSVPGLIAASVDAEAYLRALGRPAV
ncbi:MAG: hypothetical protein OEO79_07775 [Gemmatimonadota bacterium]|nr:hypothetical protein [Gemmatimonadota bacterium]